VSYGEADGCWESELLSVGAEVDAADIYVTDSEGMCVPGQDLYYDRFFEVGPAADLADLPPMTLSHEGDTRLVQMYYESGGTYLYGTGSAWDSDYETTCYPQTVAGTLYCVPDQIFTLVAGHSTFSDDACTSPIVYTQESTCYETVIPQLIGQRAEGGTMCESPGFAALYSVVPWEGDVIYQSFEDGTCLETPLADGAIYFAQGEELDPAEVLVEVTLDE
jgi:hypothetical protein